ncbi:hypothetical protein [Mycobacterium lentiflavum]|uniref:hypothetical protein n=1 Tax=Mycobacterium lentiflavum TaxID=141349 RepID=UPI000B300E6E|nr:hypothetical protein [Mycobacterium lentiflavum]
MTDVEVEVRCLLDKVTPAAKQARDLAGRHPESEHLYEAWKSLDASHTLLHRYLRLKREAQEAREAQR